MSRPRPGRSEFSFLKAIFEENFNLNMEFSRERNERSSIFDNPKGGDGPVIVCITK